MKKKIIVFLMTMAASVLAGCGADSSNVADKKKTETSDKSDLANEAGDSKDDSKNNADTSKEEASQEVNPFLGQNGLMFASEEDVVINIAGVDVSITLKEDELVTLVEKNNWESEYGHNGDREYIEGFGTPDGRVRVIVGNIKEIGPGDDLQCIILEPNLIDLSKVSLNGVTLDNVETLKNSSNLIEEDSESFEISVADYVTLNVKYNSSGELKTIRLIRQNYCYR